MILPHELRIDNWVKNGDELIKVDGYIFWHYMFPDDAKHIVEIYKIEPIPLTPEILIACGLEESGFDDQYYFCNHFMLDNKDGTFCLLIGDEEISIATIKYLHQLQNLYFALTGKEFDVKL